MKHVNSASANCEVKEVGSKEQNEASQYGLDAKDNFGKCKPGHMGKPKFHREVDRDIIKLLLKLRLLHLNLLFVFSNNCLQL